MFKISVPVNTDVAGDVKNIQCLLTQTRLEIVPRPP